MWRIGLIASMSKTSKVSYWIERGERTQLWAQDGTALIKHKGLDIYSPESDWFESRRDATQDAINRLHIMIEECKAAISSLSGEEEHEAN